jgi:hypothetical protein
MKQIIRYVIVVLVLAGILLLARNTIASARFAPEEGAPPAYQDSGQGGNPNQPGTVRPPPDTIVVTGSGTYSIGGFCNYTVEFTADYSETGISVHISRETPLPVRLPDGVHRVRQGCRVMYYQNGQPLDEFTDPMGTSKVCFAAIPGHETKIYFYDLAAEEPAWAPVPESTVEDGVVCSEAEQTAIYVATFTTP